MRPAHRTIVACRPELLWFVVRSLADESDVPDTAAHMAETESLTVGLAYDKFSLNSAHPRG